MNNEPRHIEVTLLHVLVLFASVAVIGTLLFWGGYRSGRNAAMATLKSSQDLPTIQSGENRSVETVSDPVASEPSSVPASQDTQVPSSGPEVPPSVPPAAEARDEAVRLHQVTTQEQLDQPATAQPQQEQVPAARTQPVSPRPAAVSASGAFAVQAGAFESHKEASDYANRFIAKGVPTRGVRVKVKGGTRFRGLAGSYNTRDEARAAISSLEQIGGRKGYFVQKTR